MSVSHTIDLFQTWRSVYPDWPTLRAFLESEEGGYLRIVDESDTACLIRYDKGQSRMEVPHVAWCRSVIWDKVAHCPLAVAPPKASTAPFPYDSVTLSDAMEKARRGEWAVEEYADGFMIQVYQIRDDPVVQVATRSKRDASGTFYSTKTFRSLFLEAYGESLEYLAMTEWEMEEKERYHSRWWSYLVQHPEHRVVTPIRSPRVHLIQKGFVDKTGKIIVNDGFPSLSLIDADADAESGLLVDWIQRECQVRPWWFRGIVVKDGSGQRWRFRSEKYMAIQSLRGRESSVYERYARIFTQNLSATYFEYYPEDMIPFSLCGVFVNDAIHVLYREYHALYVRKTTTLAHVHRIYRPHLYTIHGIYLSRLRPVQKWITLQDIRVYLMGLPPSRVAFLIRHHQEEYHSRVAQQRT